MAAISAADVLCPRAMAPPILTLRDVAVHADREPLFEGLELALEPGDRFCLIGRNGSGKSTLLRLMAGMVEPDRGERFVQPGTSVGVLAQDLLDRPEGTAGEWASAGLVEEGGAHKALAYLDRLGLDPDREMASLSGGEQRRAHLARTLAGEPDVLLLDEPTNHLDIRAIEWLEGFVGSWRGAVVIVSHDRAFLRRVTSSMLWLDRRTLRRRDAGFETFEAWADEVAEADAKNAARVERRISEEQRYMERGVTARRTRNQRRVAALASLRQEQAALRRAHQAQASIGLEGGVSRSNLVIEADGLTKGYEGRTIVAPFTTRVLRRDRIGIVGPNGAGKTTLIRMLTGLLEADGGTVRRAENLDIVYFDQQRQALDPDSTPWKTLAQGNSDRVMVRGESRHVVAYLRDFLFAENQARQPIRSLSGGERNRLLLARLFTRPADLLVLDEPTNDLDMETLDLLQEVLSEFPGTLIVVSHDRDFLDRLVTVTWGMEGDGRVVECPGGYADYRRQLARSAAPAAEKAQPEKTPPKTEKPKARTKLSYKDQRELDLLPDRIGALEAEIAKLETTLADAGLFTRDPDAYSAAAAGLQKAQDDLAAAEERWLELEELRESMGA
jgi:ATP-binding cassette subfamily F protein uup